MENGQILCTRNPTGHRVLIDYRFELPCGKLVVLSNRPGGERGHGGTVGPWGPESLFPPFLCRLIKRMYCLKVYFPIVSACKKINPISKYLDLDQSLNDFKEKSIYSFSYYFLLTMLVPYKEIVSIKI